MEQYVPLEPNFKRLRQQHLDGELRRSVTLLSGGSVLPHLRLYIQTICVL